MTKTKCILAPRVVEGFAFSRIENITQESSKIRLITQSNVYIIEISTPEKAVEAFSCLFTLWTTTIDNLWESLNYPKKKPENKSTHETGNDTTESQTTQFLKDYYNNRKFIQLFRLEQDTKLLKGFFFFDKFFFFFSFPF